MRFGDGDRDFFRELFVTGDSCRFLGFAGDLLVLLLGLSLRSRLLRSGDSDFLRSLRSLDLSRRLSLTDSFDRLADLDLPRRLSFTLDSSRFLLADLERSRRFSLDLFSPFFTLLDRLRSRRLSFDFNSSRFLLGDLVLDLFLVDRLSPSSFRGDLSLLLSLVFSTLLSRLSCPLFRLERSTETDLDRFLSLD